MTKSCLLVSYGPIPTPEYQQVEGGGMRIHGLASGLLKNGIDVTVAIHEHFPQKITEHEGIKITNWKHDNEFIKLINSHDTIIASYSLGESSTFIQENLNDDVQFVVDAYVPSFIEVSARESKDLTSEYRNYFNDLPRYNAVLSRGDYFLTANSAQELLYTGVLSALGVINPASYRDKRILDTPFGIHEEPISTYEDPYVNIGATSKDFRVLWFGGMYPWFRIEEYLDAIKILSKDSSVKFIFVGAKNPRNGHPDFEIQYHKALKFSKDNNLQDSMIFVDWVDYNKRAEWYKNADIIVSLNQPADENKYSWRTRVMDFVWGGAAILTNGGDPLSEVLISKNAAIRLESLESQDIATAIKNLRSNKSIVKNIKKSVEKIKPDYYWSNVTEELSAVIKSHSLPYKAEDKLRKDAGSNKQIQVTNSNTSLNKLKKAPRLIRKTARYMASKGLRRTFSVILSSSVRRVKAGSFNTSKLPQFVFISHPIDNTGAPLVLLNIIEEYVSKYGSNRIRVIAPGATPNNLTYLKSLGIIVEQEIFAANFRMIRLQLGLKPDDFVLINTSAVYPNYLQFILLWLKLGRLKHANWFIHEDYEQCKELIDQQYSLIKSLLGSGRLSLKFPSKKTMLAFSNDLGEKGLKPMMMRSEVDNKYKKGLKSKDFDSLRFIISGTTTDGRKGQLITISAFQHYLDTYYRDNPKNYRDFKLTLVSVGTDDYVSQQVRLIGKSSLGKHIEIHENMEREKALAVAHKNNVVICSSLHETYALYVAECMLMGHIVLRSDVGGVDEQLRDSVNGYLIDTKDIKQFASILERILNKNTTPNSSLETMSKASKELAKDFESSSYLDQLEK